MDNDFENNANDGASEPRPVRAPGFANVEGGALTGGASAGMQNDGGSGVAFEDKPKKNHGMLYGMILLAILAAGGIGFGVWAMLDGNSKVAKKDDEISGLKSQLAERSEIVVDDTTVVDADGGDAGTSVANIADYVYLGEWGLKIRIPEGLKKVSYKYEQTGGGLNDGTAVIVSGTTGDGLPDFASFLKNTSGLGAISRISKDTYSGSDYDGAPDDIRTCGIDAGLVFSDDEYNYCYGRPQVVYSTTENEKNLEVESINVIEQMLNNGDNYSKI
jgi:hypothetical protein